MKAHQLAHLLLALPNLPVVINGEGLDEGQVFQVLDAGTDSCSFFGPDQAETKCNLGYPHAIPCIYLSYTKPKVAYPPITDGQSIRDFNEVVCQHRINHECGALYGKIRRRFAADLQDIEILLLRETPDYTQINEIVTSMVSNLNKFNPNSPSA